MTTHPMEAAEAINRHVSENVNTLLLRAGMSRRKLALAMGGVSHAALNQKITGGSPWGLAEVVRAGQVLSADVPELMGELPPFDVWRARRDSNPKPSVLYPRRGPLTLVAVNRVLTPYYVPTEARTRHLRAVS